MDEPALRRESEYAALDEEATDREDVYRRVSPFSCPSCGGVLWEAAGEKQLRFRCRIGHAFGSESLLTEQSTELDASLAAAFRALREHAHLARRVGDRLRAAGHGDRAARYDRIEAEAEHDADVIRNVLLDRGTSGT